MNLTKGQVVNITKEAADKGAELKVLTAGAGWDGKTDAPIDLDLLGVYLDDSGKAIPDANGNGTNADESLIFFNNLKVAGAEHSGDNLTGEGDGDDEQIKFTLADVPANVKEIAVVVASYSGEKFSEVSNATVRMLNGEEVLAKYELTDDLGDTKAVEMGRIVRNGDNWEFKATGTTVAGEFSDVVKSYGVTV